MVPGRLCENGNAVPLDQEIYIEGVRLMEEAGLKAFEAARMKDQELVAEVTNEIAGACSHCHRQYRDVDIAGGDRCK
jgi:cytochrome c556